MDVSKNNGKTTQNGWFIFIMVPNPIKMDDLGAFPIFLVQHQDDGVFIGLTYSDAFRFFGTPKKHTPQLSGGKSWIEADYGKPLTKDKKEWVGDDW